MNKIRSILLALTVVFAALLAYGVWTRPSARPADHEGFSAARVIKDIEVMSKEHHSVAHPEERAKVREYLMQRLEGLGADTVMLYEYDSLVGPKNKHVVYTFDAKNIVAEFPPLEASADPTYLLMVAHYDSRYSQPMPKDTVWSYGAADDGYGVGVILETVSQVLKNRQDWKQGVKVLFTDAEEVGMMGMTALWENNREFFDNVGFMINLEARGPWGPALLFETCPGNEKVMDLYASAAKSPYTYSLTTVVYSFMPNFTDFTIVKDEVPGMNFSTIADVNHYHTDLDNFSNISAKSIQHYGAQVLPIALEYLTDEKYSDKDYFRAEDDTTNFTIPVLGLFNFSKGMYKVVNVIVFVLFLLALGFEGLRGRLKAMKVLKTSLVVLGAAVGVLLFGELVAYLSALIAGAKFKLFGVIHGIGFDNVAMIVSTVLIAAASVLVYLSGRSKAVRMASGSMRASAATNAVAKHAANTLYGTLALMFLLSAVLLFALGENLMFFVPLAFATAGLILYRLTSLKVWLLLASGMILLHAFSFLYALAMALTIGAYGAVAMLAFCDIMVLIPMADLYLLDQSKKK
ncbi:MAG: M20/M25/M40 family metallo-hydrolase [Bacteroidales bacterium]|nr:M20/M25/M40 family metallo-hydrolase [Bacteroidales bacterium]